MDIIYKRFYRKFPIDPYRSIELYDGRPLGALSEMAMRFSDPPANTNKANVHHKIKKITCGIKK